jgi:hypothetical protein
MHGRYDINNEDDIFVGIKGSGDKMVVGVKSCDGDYILHDVDIEEMDEEQKPVKVSNYDKRDGCHVGDYYRSQRRY